MSGVDEEGERQFARAWSECEAWLENAHEGFVRGAVTVRRMRADGERGVFASAPLRRGELLSATPLSAILCVACPTLRRRTESEDPDPRYALLIELLDRIGNPVLAFALLVVFELTQRPVNSPWKPYLGVVPDQVDTLEWWEERELRELDGEYGGRACWSVGSSAAIQARRASSAQYTRTIRPLIDAHPNVFTYEVSGEQWRRALTIMTTRSFYIAELGSYGMVPWADMYNHSHTISQDNKSYMPSEKRFVVRADRDYDRHEQVFVSYGPRLSNVQLLLNFGFILPDNLLVLPLVRLPPLFHGTPQSTSPPRDTLGLPSLAHLAAQRASLSIELDEQGANPKISDNLKRLYHLLATGSMPHQLRFSVARQEQFTSELVCAMLNQKGGTESSSDQDLNGRLNTVVGMRAWEERFLSLIRVSLSSSLS